MFMASSESDHDDDNGNRKVLDLPTTFGRYMRLLVRASFPTVFTGVNSVTSEVHFSLITIITII